MTEKFANTKIFNDSKKSKQIIVYPCHVNHTAIKNYL